MSNPTSNFNWQMPTATDLVTDLPADFEVFGQAVDTSLADLKGGTSGQILAKNTNADMDFVWITNDVGDITEVTAGTGISGGGTSGAVTITNSMATAIDAKGDLVPGTGADAFARLAVGANGTVLTADSAEATGLKWATPASGSMTVLASGNLATGTTTTTFSSISASYKDLRLVIRNFNGSGNNTYLMRINNDAGANYAWFVSGIGSNTNRSTGANGQTSWSLLYETLNAGNNSNLFVFDFADYANTTTRKLVNAQSTFMDSITATSVIQGIGGYGGANAAISRIDLIYGSNVNGGTYILYGVN
jgi:hypothetical protein